MDISLSELSEVKNLSNKIIQGDCLNVMNNKLDNNSIDLIVTDPPYNISKAKWDKIDNYIEWCGKWIKQCERVLKQNGSFYFFHNDFEVLAELQKKIKENTNFIFKQLIVWNKRFKNANNKGFLDGFVEVNNLRNYQKMAEYCLFYTLQDIKKDCTFSKVRDYIIREYEKAFSNQKEFNEYLGFASNGGMASRKYLGQTQWYLPKKEHYKKLQETGYFQKDYQKLKKQYEKEKYTFNNQKTHHSVWNYEIAEKRGHITPKPVPLLKNILKHSSNKGDIVLDCFAGSGTTGVACQNTNRDYILIEQEEKYIDIIKDRLKGGE